MLVIGFTNKFYTLWDVTESINTVGNGCKCKVTLHSYIKNISFDLNKVKKLYPNVDIDMSLCGHHSWSNYQYIDDRPDGIFRCGKYNNQKIVDSCDYSYMQWIINDDRTDIVHSCDMPIIETILSNAGYKRINPSYMANPKQAKEIEESFDKCDEIQEATEKNGYIDIELKSNLNDNGEITANYNDISVSVKFPKFTAYEYKGYPYYLPVDSKDKAKRIKNKSVRIYPENIEIIHHEYGWGASLKLNVKSFEINK